jgi:NAD dependent epimerase/dehydratase family
MTSSGRVLLVGGTGVFGSLLIDELVAETDADILVASRNPLRFEERIRRQADRLRLIVLDANDAASVRAVPEDVVLVVHAAGPYHSDSLALLRMALRRHLPYIDLAESCEYFRRVRALLRERGSRRDLVLSGYSTMPGLTSFFVDLAGRRLTPSSVTSDLTVGAGNARSDAALATLLEALTGDFQGRWIGFEAADADLFPEWFGVREVRCRVAFDAPFSRALFSALYRLPSSLRRRAIPPILAAGRWVAPEGSGAGRLAVEVRGREAAREWQCTYALEVEERAQRMGVLPAVLAARRILEGSFPPGLSGMPRVGAWLTEAEFRQAAARRGMRYAAECAIRSGESLAS